MPIGKDSITKRVAKTTNEEKIAPELVATTAAAPAKKPAAKKADTAEKAPAANKTATAKKPAAKKTAPKKETAPKKVVPPAEEKPSVTTGVLSGVAPETVEAVIGHKEDTKYEKVQIGQKMPDFLL